MNVHVLLGVRTLCGLAPDTWPQGHSAVEITGAMDPALLQVTCVDCAAIIHKQLGEA